MGVLSRKVFAEIASSAMLGTILFTFVLFFRSFSNRLFELLVRSAAPPETVAQLFSLILPSVLTFTIPVGVLVGILMTLSRMSGDAEITAMRAAGIASRRVLFPIVIFALLAVMATSAFSLWLTPWSIRQTYRMMNRLAAAQLTAEIQPRVFEESFPNVVLYVGDVITGTTVRWRNLFLADLSPPENRRTGAHEPGDGPRITVATEAIATPDPARNRIQLSLRDGSTHEAGKLWTEYYNSAFPRGEQILEAQKRGELRPRITFTEMDTVPLMDEAPKSVEARIELHQRFALPPACLILALVGVPLGISSRKGGKASAFVVTVAVAFIYWMGLISLIGLARQGAIPVEMAVWLPNATFLVFAIVFLLRLERPGDRDLLAALREKVAALIRSIRGAVQEGRVNRRGVSRAFWFLPQVIDAYILSTFLFYFGLLLASFVLMTHVYTFFELLSDIIKNRIPMMLVMKYLVYLTPLLIYSSAPISVLVAVLVTFGVLVRNNEVTALKACGVSVYRLAVPVLLAAGALSAGLFAFDHYILPYANRTQDAIRNQIRGRPVQTYLRPDRKWIVGGSNNSCGACPQQERIYYYRYFSQPEGVMFGVNIFELDRATFRLRKHVQAERARWEPSLSTWVFQDGWVREIEGGRVSNFKSFRGQTATFPEMTDAPSYFLREVLQDKQMNFHQLAEYIAELKQSGLDTVRLQVQYHKKFSVPLFALLMAMIGVPFAFMAGVRSATASVGFSFVIAISYWAISILFEQIGNVNQLPPVIAAWAPNSVFSLVGLWMFARMRT